MLHLLKETQNHPLLMIQYLEKLKGEEGLQSEDSHEARLTLGQKPLQRVGRTQGEFPSDQS